MRCRALLRLIGAFLLFCLVPLAFLASTSIDVAEGAVRREVTAHLATAAQATSTLLDQEAESLAGLVQSYALRPTLVAAVGAGDPARFDTGTIDFHLQQLMASRPGISGAFLTDVGGRLSNVVPPTPEIVNDDFSHRDWYRGLTETDRPYVSEAYQTAIEGNPSVVAAAVYVRAPSGTAAPGQRLAVLALAYRLDAVREFAQDLSPLKGVEVTITDQRGTVLAAPGPPPQGLVSKQDDPVVRAVLAGRSGVTTTDSPSGKTLVAYAPARSTGWTVSASIPERQALAGMGRLRSRVLTIAGVLAVGLMGGFAQLVRVQRRRWSAEATLRDSEARTRAILDGARDAFVSVASDRHITAWNLRAAELLGWSAEEALGAPLGARFLPAGTGSNDERALAHFMSGDDSGVSDRSLEVTLVTASGDEILFEVSLFASPTGDGSWHGFLRDLREHTRAQEAVAQLAAIVEGSDDAVIGVSLAGEITTWNRGAEALYGYSAQEMLGQPISRLVPPGVADERPGIVARFYRGEAVGQYETTRMRADGSTVEVSVTASPIRDAGGTIVGISKIARDISARKQTQAALEAARDEAMEASRHKSAFLANMSHEIRTPMNGVLGMTWLLLQTDLDAEQRDYAETAKRSGEALLGVINDILDFSKVEAGQLEFEHVDFDLRVVVEDTTQALAQAAEEKSLELACLVPPDLPTQLRGDPGRLRQVLTNLLSNAIKFTSRGEVVVRVALADDDPEEALVLFEVADTGMGIPPDYVDHLFDAFSQADASTTRRFGGTGLGLAITRRLVELMGGTISVATVPGQGSTFAFTARFEKVAGGHVRPPRQPRHDLVGLRVLVVDDH
ncbi:MAG: PAS domain S-box protein, partial [Actinomycetota bacterium]|nr:PAS domain S-box protein [Actinomycetota bacterium]